MFGDFEDSREESHISGPINEKVGLERIHEAIPAPVSKRTNIEHEGGRASRIRIRNRRRIYLDNNPDYFSNPDLELADPLLYDKTIRKFQTTTEREIESKAKGYGRVLEADLLRGEARLASLPRRSSTPSHSNPSTSTDSNDAKIRISREAAKLVRSAGGLPSELSSILSSPSSCIRPAATTHLVEVEEKIGSKEEGLEIWKEAMRGRFVEGGDEEFEYRVVDEDEELDVLERREREECWFEDEEPGWVDEGGKGRGGETGVQDF